MLSRMSHLIQVMVRYLGCEVDGVSDTGALRGGGGTTRSGRAPHLFARVCRPNVESRVSTTPVSSKGRSGMSYDGMGQGSPNSAGARYRT